MPTCDSWISWPPTALGIAPTLAPMPKPLSRIQLVTVRLPRPPDPAVAASAPMSAQSIGCGRPVKLKNPRKVSSQCEIGTNAMLMASRNRNTTQSIVQAKYSSMRSMVPPNERMSTTKRMSPVATQACVA